jgi:8-oxo-dGTP pyrophosphatase MutT (NUDIX family)
MHAAERELAEELGLRGKAVAYIGTWMDKYGQPVGEDIVDHTANSAYLVELEDWDGDLQLQRNEVLSAGWFPFNDLPDDLAFPEHLAQMLSAACAMASVQQGASRLPDRIW